VILKFFGVVRFDFSDDVDNVYGVDSDNTIDNNIGDNDQAFEDDLDDDEVYDINDDI